MIGRTLEARLPTSYLISSNVWLPICQKRRPENLSLPAGPAVAGGHHKNDAGIKNKGCVCVCVHVRVSVCMHSGPASLNSICSWSEHGRGVACDFCRVSLVTSVPVSLVTSQSLPLQNAAMSRLLDLWLPRRPSLALLPLLLPLPPPPPHPHSWCARCSGRICP